MTTARDRPRPARKPRSGERELAEARDRLHATSEILRVIADSRSDVRPVFEAIVRSAVSLCGSLFANVFRFDGELLHFAASHNVGPSYVELLQAKYPMRPVGELTLRGFQRPVAAYNVVRLRGPS
jgi:hypothetical protein